MIAEQYLRLARDHRSDLSIVKAYSAKSRLDWLRVVSADSHLRERKADRAGDIDR